LLPVLVFFTAHLLESRYRALLWFDAAALAVAVPAGVAVALAEGEAWPIVLVMGMITGCMGGMLRDVVCNEVPLVLKQGELYVTCALAGSLGAVLALRSGPAGGAALVLCATLVLYAAVGKPRASAGACRSTSRSPPRPGAPKR
jgi:uncharacterized membrane protein YeiH